MLKVLFYLQEKSNIAKIIIFVTEKFQNKYKGRAKAGAKASSGDQRKPQTLFNQDD